MKLILILNALLFTIHVMSQPMVKVEMSADTVMVGEVVEVSFTIEDGDGKFNIPDMSELPVVSGPNTSSSFMYQNGKMSANQSYGFLLRPMQVGKLIIPESSYQMKDETLIIQQVEIVVISVGTKASSPKTITETPSSKVTREKKKI